MAGAAAGAWGAEPLTAAGDPATGAVVVAGAAGVAGVPDAGTELAGGAAGGIGGNATRGAAATVVVGAGAGGAAADASATGRRGCGAAAGWNARGTQLPPELTNPWGQVEAVSSRRRRMSSSAWLVEFSVADSDGRLSDAASDEAVLPQPCANAGTLANKNGNAVIAMAQTLAPRT